MATYRIPVYEMSSLPGDVASEDRHAVPNRKGQTALDIVHSAFLTAYLLTGSCKRSEDSVEHAVDICNAPLQRSELLLNTVRAALRYPATDANDYLLHPALARIIRLPNAERRCFVLRCLLGLDPGLVARLLLLQVSEVSRYTMGAIQLLAAASNS